MLTLCFLAYGGATGLHASGFAAVYVGALVLGNQELPHRAATRSFAEGVAGLSQIGLFVMLGLLLSPGRITLENVGTRLPRMRPHGDWIAVNGNRPAFSGFQMGFTGFTRPRY